MATLYYTTADEIRKLYKKIDTAGMTDNDIGFFIVQAETELNSRLAKRYALPFDSVPSMVKVLASELTVLKILEKQYTAGSMKGGDHLEYRKDKVLDTLDRLVSGEQELIDSDLHIVATRSDLTGIESSTKDYEPTFNELPPELQRVDPDKLSDTLDEVY